MATTPEFKYAPMFQTGKDETEYYLLTKEGVSVAEFNGKEVLMVSKEALTTLTQQAFYDVSFHMRRAHNEQVAKILYSGRRRSAAGCGYGHRPHPHRT